MKSTPTKRKTVYGLKRPFGGLLKRKLNPVYLLLFGIFVLLPGDDWKVETAVINKTRPVNRAMCYMQILLFFVFFFLYILFFAFEYWAGYAILFYFYAVWRRVYRLTNVRPGRCGMRDTGAPGKSLNRQIYRLTVKKVDEYPGSTNVVNKQFFFFTNPINRR